MTHNKKACKAVEEANEAADASWEAIKTTEEWKAYEEAYARALQTMR